LLLASLVYRVVSRFTLRPSARVKLSNLTEIKAVPFTRPPGSELTTTPSTGAPFFAITQSPSTIGLAKLAVNFCPFRAVFVDRSEEVKTEMVLPSNNVLVRDAGGGVALSADLGALGSESAVPALRLVGFLAGALATFDRLSVAVRETEAAVGAG